MSRRFSLAIGSVALVAGLVAVLVALAGDGDARWEAEQRDGVGDYTAQYAMERGEKPSSVKRQRASTRR